MITAVGETTDRDHEPVENRSPPADRELIRRVVNSHGDAIGLDSLRPYDLVRTLAGVLDARGVPLQDIQLVLRHDTLGPTQRYLAENPLRVRRRVREFTIELSQPVRLPGRRFQAIRSIGVLLS